jgi:hypothetical protein
MTVALKIMPLFGEGTFAKSAVVTRQRRLNVYLEQRKDRDKTRIAIYGTPGLVLDFSVSTPFDQPLRGFQGTQTALYAVSYNQFLSLSSTGSTLASGTLGTTAGLVSIAYSPTQVVIVDGSSGYTYTPATTTFATIPSFPATGARTVTFVAGFFVAEQPGTQKFWVSNAFDGTTWNPLSFASAASGSDNIVAVNNLNGNLIVFRQLGMEFWQNQGLVPQPFAPILSGANNWGLAAIFSVVHVLGANDQDTLVFLGQSESGQVQLVQVSGFTPQVISDPDMESIWNSFSVVSDATAYTYQVDTHRFYQINFPTANRSFIFDMSTGVPGEVQTGTSVTPVRHTGNLGTYYAGQTLVADYATNQVYTLNPNVYTDNGVTIIRQIITRHVLSSFNRIRVSMLYLDMETGVGLQSGQGSNPQIMLEYSKDNGRTWSAQRWASSGLVGNYIARVIWRRFGCTRDATWRITMSDPVKFVITEGAFKMRAAA